METYTDLKKTNKWNLRKINLFIFFSLQVLLIEACQFKLNHQDLLLSDEIRNRHAEQILADQLSVEQIKIFNGDPHFNRYIATYVHKKNKSLDINSFTTSLLTLSREHSYDPIFLLAVIKTESSFNQNAIGRVGEVGLMQIRPETAEWIAGKNNIVWRGARALKDPQYNLLIGSYYFHYLRTSLQSESLKYITAYNMGLSKMKRQTADQLKEHVYFSRVVKNYLSIYSELLKIKKTNRV